MEQLVVGEWHPVGLEAKRRMAGRSNYFLPTSTPVFTAEQMALLKSLVDAQNEPAAWSGTTMENQPDVCVGPVDTNYHNLRMTFEGNRGKVHWDGVQRFDVVDNNFEGPVYADGGFTVGLYATNSSLMSIEEVIVTLLVPVATDMNVVALVDTATNLVLQGSIGSGTD